MKLIELRLKNLNSLKGEWHIDFSDEAFLSEGIFAITGQTGAGKTTLLDAICLALYGKTPRIKSISKTSNEVMTRQTGDCFSEVVIELDNTRYRCRWGQRRAYGKPNGNLQDASHELAQINGGDASDVILEEKLSCTQNKIIKLLGMDFNQFTRSILLAQGSFSAFLTAGSDERADILEKITGVDIYATISKRVHEHKREQEAKLNTLTAGLAGLSLLSEEEEIALLNQQQQHQAALIEKEQQLATLTRQLNWLANIRNLQSKINEHQASLTELQHQSQTFAPQKQRLQQAMRALELDSQYADLKHAREQLGDLQSDAAKLTDALPMLQSQLQTLSNERQHSHQQVTNIQNKLNDALPFIKQIRKLDTAIIQSRQQLDSVQNQVDGLTMQVAQTTEQMTDSKQQQQHLQKQLNKTRIYVEAHASFARLHEVIPTIEHLGTTLSTNLQDIQKTLTAYTQNLDHQNEHIQTIGEVEQRLSLHEQTQAKRAKALEHATTQLSDLLQNQPLSEWQQDQEQTLTTRHQLQANIQVIEHCTEHAKDLQATLKSLPSLYQAQTKFVAQTCQLDRRLIQLSTMHTDKTELLGVRQQMATLIDYVHLLKDNQPCPLCGSTDHPEPINTDSGSQTDKITVLQAQIIDLSDQIEHTRQQLAMLNRQSDANASTIKAAQAKVTQTACQLYQSIVQQTDTFDDKAADNFNGAIYNHLFRLKTSIATVVDYEGTLTDWHSANHPTQVSFDETPNNSPTENSLDDPIHVEHACQVVASWQTILLDLHQAVKQALSNKNKHLATIKSVLTQHAPLSACIQQMQTELANMQHELQRLQRQRIEANTQLQLLKHRQQDNEERLSHLQTTLTQDISRLVDCLSPYQPVLSDILDIDAFLEQLNTIHTDLQSAKLINSEDVQSLHDMLPSIRHIYRKLKQENTTYQHALEHKQTLLSHLSQLEQKIHWQQSDLVNKQSELAGLNQQLDNQTTTLNSQQTKRQNLMCEAGFDTMINNEFDCLDSVGNVHKTAVIDDVERRLRQQVDEAKTELANAEQRFAEHNQRVTHHRHTLAKLNEQTSKLMQTVETLHADFEYALDQQNFVNEDAFLSARLPATEREALSHQEQTLNRDLTMTQETVSQLSLALKDAQKQTLTDASQQQLEQTSTLIQNQLNALRENVGGIRQKIADNETKKSQQSQQQQAINEQKKSLEIWQKLHHLIGSGDGKKYRNFAQGLTFDVMIGHANEQLKKMSDRYVLIRDDTHPLELNVLDNYQGGEIRTTKNLSGGEGFIISLALALGLSQMASGQAGKSVSVDSLFLDEGFGTLDADSLDVALDTLTNLRQTGKIIGIISHVETLKERISTQIKVEKGSNGHSKLVGAGCYSINFGK